MANKHILETFDRQIKKELIEFGEKNECPSYWAKNIYLQSLNMDISDWKKMRDEEYWMGRDRKQGIERQKFIYDSLIRYNSNN